MGSETTKGMSQTACRRPSDVLERLKRLETSSFDFSSVFNVRCIFASRATSLANLMKCSLETSLIIPIIFIKGNHSGQLKGSGGNISSGSMALNTSFLGSKKEDAILTVPSRLVMIAVFIKHFSNLSFSFSSRKYFNKESRRYKRCFFRASLLKISKLVKIN